MTATPRQFFRFFAIAEVISWTLLIGGLILRATHGWDIAVKIGGGIHGFIFLSYGVTAVLMAKNQRWTALPATISIVSTVIPYATVPVDIWLQRSGQIGRASCRERGEETGAAGLVGAKRVQDDT